MINAENLIFEGEYLIPANKENLQKTFNNFKDSLISYLISVNYIPQDGIFNISATNFFTWSFIMKMGDHIELPLKYRLLDKLGNKYKVEKYKVSKDLSLKRIELPYIIEFKIKLTNQGFNIIVRSRPVCYVRLGQGAFKSSVIDEEKYSFIKAENTQFISDVMSAIHAEEINAPKAKSLKLKFSLSDKLRNLKLNELADLSDKGYSKIKNGNIEDGLSDLRTVFEKLLVEIVKFSNNNPESQTKIKENLDILRKQGFIDERMNQLLKETLQGFLYNYLSGIPSHHREKSHLISQLDAEYAYSLFEDSLKYLLDKVQRRS